MSHIRSWSEEWTLQEKLQMKAVSTPSIVAPSEEKNGAEQCAEDTKTKTSAVEKNKIPPPLRRILPQPPETSEEMPYEHHKRRRRRRKYILKPGDSKETGPRILKKVSVRPADTLEIEVGATELEQDYISWLEYKPAERKGGKKILRRFVDRKSDFFPKKSDASPGMPAFTDVEGKMRNIKGVKIRLSTSPTSLLPIECTVSSCYICKAGAAYYEGGYFCKICIKRFGRIVITGVSTVCPRGGKCTSLQECDFCFAEKVYGYGVRATSVEGFKLGSLAYEPFTDASEPLPLNEEESAFCRYYNKMLTDVLDWVWKQGDLLKLTANDRISLLQENAGRARLMWIAADACRRHNVVKTDDSYLAIDNFSSEIVKRTVVDIWDLSQYFRSLSLTPFHLYFIKLLSILQIGKSTDCDIGHYPHGKCGTAEDVFERKDDIILLVENYRRTLRTMNISNEDMALITDLIDMLYCVNSIMSTEGWVEDFQYCLFQWTVSHTEWEDRRVEPSPPPLSSYSEEIELSVQLNNACILALKYTDTILKSYVSSRDEKVLLRKNMMSLIVACVCYNMEDIEDSCSRKMENKNIQSFYVQIKMIQESLKPHIVKHFSFSDFIFVCLSQHFPGAANHLHDINLRDLEEYASKNMYETLQMKLEKENPIAKERCEELQRVLNSVGNIIGRIQKAAVTLEAFAKSLPLLINVKYWLRE